MKLTNERAQQLVQQARDIRADTGCSRAELYATMVELGYREAMRDYRAGEFKSKRRVNRL